MNLITYMKLLRGTMRMLTLLFLLMMKGVDGPALTEYPNTGPQVKINARAGENKQLMTKDESAQKDILSFQWFFRKENANEVTYCQDMSGNPERYSVNPSYSSKVEWCNATSILLKNISSHDEGKYILQVLKNHVGKAENFTIFLSVSAPDNHSINMFGLLGIIPGLLVLLIIFCCVRHRKKIVSWTRRRRDTNTSNPSSSVSADEPEIQLSEKGSSCPISPILHVKDETKPKCPELSGTDQSETHKALLARNDESFDNDDAELQIKEATTGNTDPM